MADLHDLELLLEYQSQEEDASGSAACPIDEDLPEEQSVADILAARRQGRPTGSQNWSQAAAAALRRESAEVEADTPQPGDIAYARQAREAKRRREHLHQQTAGAQQLSCLPEVPERVQETAGPQWLHWATGLGSSVQENLRQAVVCFRQQTVGTDVAEDTFLARLFQPRRTHASLAAVKEFENTGADLSKKLNRAAAAAMQGASLWWGTFLCACGNNVTHSNWKPLAYIHKLLYDETPLDLRVQSGPVEDLNLESVCEQSPEAKVMQIRQSIHTVFYDAAKSSFLLLGGLVPVPLQVLPSGSGAAIKKSLKNAKDRACKSTPPETRSS